MTDVPKDVLALARTAALEAADAAAEITRGYFRQGIAVDSKADETPVTRADREAESAVRAVLERYFPDHGVIGEEYGSDNPDAEFVWVIDPIDGTKQFVTGNVGYGSLIALARRGKPLLGLIDMPMKRERWIAVEGEGARFTDHRGEHEARVRPCPSLSQAVVTTTSVEMFGTPESLAAFERLRAATRFTVYGNDCYGFGLLASGYLDLACEAQLGVYDFMALAPVVTEAGGIITNWRGEPVGLESGDRVLAAGDPEIHAAALSLLDQSA